MPAFLYLGAIGVALAAIDLDVHRLPNKIMLPSYAVVGLLLVPAVGTRRLEPSLRAGLGGLALYAFYFGLDASSAQGHGLRRRQAGRRPRPVPWAGSGWGELVVGGFLGFLLGGVVGGGLMAVGRAGRKSKIPFGPFMMVGAFLAVLFGPHFADLYLDTLRS